MLVLVDKRSLHSHGDSKYVFLWRHHTSKSNKTHVISTKPNEKKCSHYDKKSSETKIPKKFRLLRAKNTTNSIISIFLVKKNGVTNEKKYPKKFSPAAQENVFPFFHHHDAFFRKRMIVTMEKLFRKKTHFLAK